MFMVLSSWLSHCEFTQLFDLYRAEPSGRQPLHQANRFQPLVRPTGSYTVHTTPTIATLIPLLKYVPMSPWEYDLWATKSKGVGLSARAISFKDFQPMSS